MQVRLLPLLLSSVGAAAGALENLQLSGREEGYTEVVKALNEANLSCQKYDAVSAFANVAAKDATGDFVTVLFKDADICWKYNESMRVD